MAKGEKTFNICGNWGLKCFTQQVHTDDSGEPQYVILGCSLNGKKKNDGTYPKGIQVSVYCPLDGTCDIVEQDHSNSIIDVDGTIGVKEYKKKNGELVSTLSIYASRVALHEWNNNRR